MKSRHWRLWLVFVMALVLLYGFSWTRLERLGAVGPMANMAYFHYGEYQSASDSALYAFYYPAYQVERLIYSDTRYGTHWRDRDVPQ